MHSNEELREVLRALMKDGSEKRLTKTVAFYGEKLLSVSSDLEDVYLVAMSYHDNEEYRRAVGLLLKHKLTNRSTKYLYLAAKCFLECDEWGESSALLGTDKEDDRDMHIDEDEEWKAPMCLLRGRVCEKQENLEQAITWYRRALLADPYCYDAFHALINRKLISPSEERKLISDLICSPDQYWIKPFYTCVGSKYVDDFEVSVNEIREASRAHEYDTATPSPVIHEEDVEEVRRCTQRLDELSREVQENSRETLSNHASEEEAVEEGLEYSLDIQLSRAEWYLCKGSYAKAYYLTTQLLESSPDTLEVYPIHLACCLELKKQNELYCYGHELSQKHPDTTIGWFAIGMYYTCIKRFNEARKAFGRAHSVSKYFIEAWISYGNVYAFQFETEPALHAYRTAYRLFPGSHLPALYIGMERLRLYDLLQARISFNQALDLCPEDPLVSNELGVLEYYERNYEAAIEWFQQAANKLPEGEGLTSWVNIFINLGHALRKQRRYEEAVKQYQSALVYCPNEGEVHTALGFTYHLQAKFRQAIENYQMALVFDSHDQFAIDLLEKAMEDQILEN